MPRLRRRRSTVRREGPTPRRAAGAGREGATKRSVEPDLQADAGGGIRESNRLPEKTEEVEKRRVGEKGWLPLTPLPGRLRGDRAVHRGRHRASTSIDPRVAGGLDPCPTLITPGGLEGSTRAWSNAPNRSATTTGAVAAERSDGAQGEASFPEAGGFGAAPETCGFGSAPEACCSQGPGGGG